MALILNAISPQIGGVLIRGERGTAKSTAARAMAALLPEIDVFVDSPFSDDPNSPDTWSDWVKERVARGEQLAVGKHRIRFVDLPVSATEDRVVGTLDIEQAIKKGERHFEPGVLAAANRGLLYVDEVNLLDDHVVDLLLDSAAMGVNVVEREGISFAHPARFIFVGTMNPEEGDLRPQLLDRFALCVDIQSISHSAARMDILERTLQFERDSEHFYQEWRPKETELAEQIMQAREMLPGVIYTRRDLYTIAELMSEMKVDGHRGDIVILKTALAHAAFNNRTKIKLQDILVAAELALPHRLKRQPFQDTAIQFQELAERLQQVRDEASDETGQEQTSSPSESMSSFEEKKNDSEAVKQDENQSAPPMAMPSQPDQDSKASGDKSQANTPVNIGQEFTPRRLQTQLDRMTRSVSGKRSYTKTDRKRGRYVQARPAHGRPRDLAFDATLRAAAPYQIRRDRSERALVVEKQDIQDKVRVRRASNLILFVVDASWSMAAAERMEATKGAIMSLLLDAYQRRDQVGLVVFQKEEARVVLPPTTSVELAKHALADVPVGGKTPLSAGLFMAHRVMTRQIRLHPEIMPLMILLTDGAGNVSVTNLPAQEEAHMAARMIEEEGIRSVVINMEHASFDRGLAQALADELGGPCYTLGQLRADTLYRTVKGELKLG